MFRGFRAGTIMVVPNTLSLALEEVASPSFVSWISALAGKYLQDRTLQDAPVSICISTVLFPISMVALILFMLLLTALNCSGNDRTKGSSSVEGWNSSLNSCTFGLLFCISFQDGVLLGGGTLCWQTQLLNSCSLNTYYRSCHTLGIFSFLVCAFCLNICNILTLSLAIPFVVIKLMHCFCTVVGYFFQLVVCCFGCFAINYAFLQFQLRFLWQVLAESTVRDTIHESVSNHFIFQGAKWTCISSVRSEKA